MVPSWDTEYLQHDVATSRAFYTYLATSIDKCLKSNVEFFLSALAKVAQRVASQIDIGSSQVDLSSGIITIDSEGQVSGFRQCLSNVPSVPVARNLLQEPSP